MIFVCGSQQQFDGHERFFYENDFECMAGKTTDVFEGMAREALVDSQPVDIWHMRERFTNRFGIFHPATEFWYRTKEQCALSTWETVDPYIGLIELGILNPCILAADQVPWIWDENAYTVLNGSRLYGLQNSESDWDTTILTDKLPVRYSFLCPSTRAFHEKDFATRAAQGCRHALELIYAPRDCILHEANKGSMVESARQYVTSVLTPKAVLTWHEHYKRTYLPVVSGVSEKHDRYVTRWTLAKRWPYKIGYYLLVDALIARHYCQTLRYELREPFEDEETKRLVVLCKHGDMSFDAWKAFFDSIVVGD